MVRRRRDARGSERNLTLATAANCARLRHEWHARWNVKGGADGTAVLVEKSPADTTRARYLAWAFPGARFALLLRHPLLKCRCGLEKTHRFGCRRVVPQISQHRASICR